MMDDVIRRTDALKTFQDICSDVPCRLCPMMEDADTMFCKLERWIEELPSAERTGEWKYKMHDAYIQRTCSACGWSERMYHRNRNQDGLARNYCPNCGARMKGEEE